MSENEAKQEDKKPDPFNKLANSIRNRMEKVSKAAREATNTPNNPSANNNSNNPESQKPKSNPRNNNQEDDDLTPAQQQELMKILGVPRAGNPPANIPSPTPSGGQAPNLPPSANIPPAVRSIIEAMQNQGSKPVVTKFDGTLSRENAALLSTDFASRMLNQFNKMSPSTKESTLASAKQNFIKNFESSGLIASENEKIESVDRMVKNSPQNSNAVQLAIVLQRGTLPENRAGLKTAVATIEEAIVTATDAPPPTRNNRTLSDIERQAVKFAVAQQWLALTNRSAQYVAGATDEYLLNIPSMNGFIGTKIDQTRRNTGEMQIREEVQKLTDELYPTRGTRGIKEPKTEEERDLPYVQPKLSMTIRNTIRSQIESTLPLNEQGFRQWKNSATQHFSSPEMLPKVVAFYNEVKTNESRLFNPNTGKKLTLDELKASSDPVLKAAANNWQAHTSDVVLARQYMFPKGEKPRPANPSLGFALEDTKVPPSNSHVDIYRNLTRNCDHDNELGVSPTAISYPTTLPICPSDTPNSARPATGVKK